MPIEIAINTSNYDKRLCWMLSSLLQQSSMDYTIMMSYIKDSPTEKVIEHFRKAGLPFSQMLVQPDRAAVLDRGHRRTDMLKATQQPWIMFTDSDVVYPPNFISKLNGLLTSGALKDCKCCITPTRGGTELDPAEALVAGYTYPCTVPAAYAKAGALEVKPKANVGAGYCHIVNKAAAMDKLGVYMPEGLRMDYINKYGQYRTKSDKWFRRSMGKHLIRRPKTLPMQIHIQHRRDNYAVSDN